MCLIDLSGLRAHQDRMMHPCITVDHLRLLDEQISKLGRKLAESTKDIDAKDVEFKVGSGVGLEKVDIEFSVKKEKVFPCGNIVDLPKFPTCGYSVGRLPFIQMPRCTQKTNRALDVFRQIEYRNIKVKTSRNWALIFDKRRDNWGLESYDKSVNDDFIFRPYVKGDVDRKQSINRYKWLTKFVRDYKRWQYKSYHENNEVEPLMWEYSRMSGFSNYDSDAMNRLMLKYKLAIKKSKKK